MDVDTDRLVVGDGYASWNTARYTRDIMRALDHYGSYVRACTDVADVERWRGRVHNAARRMGMIVSTWWRLADSGPVLVAQVEGYRLDHVYLHRGEAAVLPVPTGGHRNPWPGDDDGGTSVVTNDDGFLRWRNTWGTGWDVVPPERPPYVAWDHHDDEPPVCERCGDDAPTFDAHGWFCDVCREESR